MRQRIYLWINQLKQNKPQHDKTNKMTCAPNEDSDQPSLISLHCAIFGQLRTQAFFRRTVKTDRHDLTEGMPRLICVFPGSTLHFVGFVMLQLKLHVPHLKGHMFQQCDFTRHLESMSLGPCRWKFTTIHKNFYLPHLFTKLIWSLANSYNPSETLAHCLFK